MKTLQISENIKYYRKMYGFTQKEYSKKLGLSRSLLAMYETGKRTPSVEISRKMAKSFNISLYELINKDNSDSDLSTEKFNDFYIKIEDLYKETFRIVPFVTSDEAFKDDYFKKTYREHKLMLNRVNNNNLGYLFCSIYESYLKLWKEHKIVEAAINILSILTLIMISCIMGVNSLNLCSRCLPNSYINNKSVKDYYVVTETDEFDDDIHRVKNFFAKEYNQLYLDILTEIKNSPIWVDLADYYSAFYICFNLDVDDADRWNVLYDFLEIYKQMGNKYAKDFLKIANVTNCDIYCCEAY